MAIAPPLTMFNEILDFLASTPTPEDIIAFKPSDTLSQRALYLLERNREDELTSEERIEMDEFMRMNHFMNMLKIRSRLKLANKT